MQALVDACVSKMTCGIYTSASGWVPIVGSSWSYPASKGLPLWYAHYDGKPSFSDFKAFGGWAKPSMKQYIGDHTSCGVGLDYNYFAGSASSLVWNASGLE